METENRQVWTNENQFLVCAAIKLILLTIFLYYISNWFILQPESTNNPNTTTTTVTINQTNTTTTKKQPKPKPQPTTPKPTQKHLFNSLLDFLVLHHDTCTPEDVTNPLKHRLPPPRHRNSSSNRVAEPKAPVVIYVAVVLLLTSLGAAFLEVYRAKGEPAKTETKMSRKCSLADLTVMRHHRKELVRRESILEEAPKSATGRKVTRTALMRVVD